MKPLRKMSKEELIEHIIRLTNDLHKVITINEKLVKLNEKIMKKARVI